MQAHIHNHANKKKKKKRNQSAILRNLLKTSQRFHSHPDRPTKSISNNTVEFQSSSNSSNSSNSRGSRGSRGSSSINRRK